MIILRIQMVSGEEFIIRNFFSENINMFINGVLLKNQTELNWYEVIPGTFIKVSQIESITQLSEDDLEAAANTPESGELKDGDEIVLPENKPNEDLEKTEETQEVPELSEE